MNVYRKVVAAARYQLYVGFPVRPIAERLSQRVHLLREIRVLDERVRPEGFHKLAFGHAPLRFTREQQQEIERFWRKSNGAAGALEPTERSVEPVRSELVQTLLRHCLSALRVY